MPQMNRQRQKQEFQARKNKILSALASGEPDSSPKGSVDDHIVPLIELLNQRSGVVTTSSCSGRVSVFLQGRKAASSSPHLDGANTDGGSTDGLATAGGKGGGGRWLMVTHDPLPEHLVAGDDAAFLHFIFGGIPSEPDSEPSGPPARETRYIHFKFEPMILHVLAENLEIANALLTCATASSFRESGIVNPLRNPVVAVRAAGLAFDAPIGLYDEERGVIKRLLGSSALKTLARLANYRFEENFRRIAALNIQITTLSQPKADVESKLERARRKRAEGLDRQKEKRLTDRKDLGVLGTDSPDGGTLF